MKSKKTKLLQLNKQTIAGLDRVSLSHINGGNDDELPITFGCPTYLPNLSCPMTCTALSD